MQNNNISTVSKSFMLMSAVLLLGTLLFSVPSQTFARIPYGGNALFTNYCTCTTGCLRVGIGIPGSRPPGIHVFMYCPGVTQQRMNYRVFPPFEQLGWSAGYLPCLMYSGNSCVDIGGGPLMILNGDS